MVKTLLRGFAPAALCATLLAAQAQTSAPIARPDPLDAQARVPALVYRSSLVLAPLPGADKPVPWRDANDTVGRIGGWRAYAREAQAPEPAASVPAHAGHKTP